MLPFADYRNWKLQTRLTLIVLAAAVCGGLTYYLLAPGQFRKQSANYKFMHCTTCGMERAYEKALANQKCMKCQPPKVGYYEPTEASVGAGGRGNPWRNFYVATLLEGVAFLAILVYSLRPTKSEEKEPNLRCACPHCKWRLRFRASLAGKDGKCPRCRKAFRFPEDAPVEETEEVG